jgi:hypothetical protein
MKRYTQIPSRLIPAGISEMINNLIHTGLFLDSGGGCVLVCFHLANNSAAKRIQPCILGAHLAEMTLFLNVSSILAVFNISKPVADNGVEVEPTMAWTTGTIMLVHDTYD